ncbi:MAG: hypothetical protein WC758_08820, partial [Candidatus Woesearchaeota archaeon]
MSQQKEILQWANDTFGPIASDKEERVKRFAEEAIELCHACGANYNDLLKLVDAVYAKTNGNTTTEIGQVGVCLLTLSEVYHVDALDEIDKEFDRVRSFNKEYWQA